MATNCEQKVEVENLIDYGKALLSREARAMALLLIDTYFPCIAKPGDISCRNCQSYVNLVCSGKRLDYQGVIECMVNKAIHGADYPGKIGSLLKSQS
jgi:hypothetical protein